MLFRRTIRRLLYPRWLHFLCKRVAPLSRNYGMDRRIPVDRYFIEAFLDRHAGDIKGACLEIRDGRYMTRYAGALARTDILDIDPANPAATLHGDIRRLTGVADNAYDRLILTQLFQHVDDLQSAIQECHRILKPGGVLLATVPAVGRLDPSAKTGNSGGSPPMAFVECVSLPSRTT